MASLVDSLTASAFKQLGQYASSPGNTACYCYTELAVFCLSGGRTVVIVYPRKDGEVELTSSLD